MIVAGTAVGAGLFAMPMVTAGVWFSGSALLLVYTWMCMLCASLMILEANLNYPIGTSFNTLVHDLLGKHWHRLNNLSLLFVLYILTYAYLSAGGDIVNHTLQTVLGTTVQQPLASLPFSLLLATVVWHSTRAVDRVSILIVGAMIITFLLAISELLGSAQLITLLNSRDPKASYLPYSLTALPYLLTAFGFHGNVPSLVKYYSKNVPSIVRSLLLGSLIALAIYLLWQLAIFGNLERATFSSVAVDGSNVDSLLKRLALRIPNYSLRQTLTLFSHLAIASSFLGVTLGLFDYLADSFHWEDSCPGRLKSALLTFVPPTLGDLLFPNGFLYAIGFAGLAATIWAVIIPALMARASRRRFPQAVYRTPGKQWTIYWVMTFGGVNVLAHLLSLAKLLPCY